MNASKQFEIELRKNLEKNPTEKRRAKRILAILDELPSRQRTRRLARMERAARAAVGSGAIDWSAIDWMAILSMLIELLLKLLPLILASELQEE